MFLWLRYLSFTCLFNVFLCNCVCFLWTVELNLICIAYVGSIYIITLETTKVPPTMACPINGRLYLTNWYDHSCILGLFTLFELSIYRFFINLRIHEFHGEYSVALCNEAIIALVILYTCTQQLCVHISLFNHSCSSNDMSDCAYGAYQTNRLYENNDNFDFPASLSSSLTNPIIFTINSYQVSQDNS